MDPSHVPFSHNGVIGDIAKATFPFIVDVSMDLQ